jgi:hypothetical protein
MMISAGNSHTPVVALQLIPEPHDLRDLDAELGLSLLNFCIVHISLLSSCLGFKHSKQNKMTVT